MHAKSRLFDDVAKMAGGAINTFGALREEIETRVKERVERMLADMNLVSREEFDATALMATKALDECESLTARLEALERRIEASRAEERPAPVEPPASNPS